MKNDNKSLHFSRRGFLTAMAALPLMNNVNSAKAMESQTEVFINGHHDQAGNYFISGMNLKGDETFRLNLPEMPHGFAMDNHHGHKLVVFPGLTGQKLVVMDLANNNQLAEIKIRKNRYFNGHGAFSQDGRFLFATENVFATSQGVIGVYDAKTYEFIREIPGYGIGPHGLRAMPDGKTLVIATGGLETHPATGKFFANLNSMQSAVQFIDIESGALLASRQIPVKKLSIRNIYFAGNNRLLVTCQYYGKRQMPKIVGLIEGMGEIEMLDIDEDNLWNMKSYTGGTVVSGDIAAVSCPRGNHLTFWDLKQKKFMSKVKIDDVSGIQPYGDGMHFLATAETGKLYKINANSLQLTQLDKPWAKAKWTNHMVKALV